MLCLNPADVLIATKYIFRHFFRTYDLNCFFFAQHAPRTSFGGCLFGDRQLDYKMVCLNYAKFTVHSHARFILNQ